MRKNGCDSSLSNITLLIIGSKIKFAFPLKALLQRFLFFLFPFFEGGVSWLGRGVKGDFRERSGGGGGKGIGVALND